MIQLQFINYLLDSKDKSLITLNSLDDKFFSEYKKEFNFIKDHIDRFNQIPDKETFLSNFKNFELLNVNESENYLISELFRDYNTRVLTESFNEVRKNIISDNIDDAIKEYTLIQDKLLMGTSMNCVDLIEDKSRFNDYVEKTKDFNKFFISTGFKELDNVISGWDREEELAVIAARTGQGKTWILLKCATAAAEQGLNVGIYSGEMTERKVGYRVDSLIGHISNGSMIHGNESILNEYEDYMNTLNEKIKGHIRVLTPKSVNGSVTVTTLRAFIEKYNLDILFIDQMSLLDDQRKAKNQTEGYVNISKDLKKLQTLLRKPIIYVNQQNRTSTESGEANTTQIAGSDRIGQDATNIFFIERDSKDKNILKIIIVKSRDNVTGKVLSYLVDLNTGSFKYIPSEDDANEGVTDINYAERYDVSGEEAF